MSFTKGASVVRLDSLVEVARTCDEETPDEVFVAEDLETDVFRCGWARKWKRSVEIVGALKEVVDVDGNGEMV